MAVSQGKSLSLIAYFTDMFGVVLSLRASIAYVLFLCSVTVVRIDSAALTRTL